MQNAYKFAQLSAVIFWIAFVVNLAAPFPAPWEMVVWWAGLILLVAHALELVLVYGKLKAIGKAGSKDILMVMLAGFTYWVPLLKK